MNQEFFRQLLLKYVTGDLSAQDKATLNDLVKRPEYADTLNEFIDEFMEKNDWEGQENPAIGMAIHDYLDNAIKHSEQTDKPPAIHAGGANANLNTSGNRKPKKEDHSPDLDDGRKLFKLSEYRKTRTVAAAFILVLAGIGTTAILMHNSKMGSKNVIPSVASVQTTPPAPGVNGAVLTLSNGETIVLDSAGNGPLARQGQTRLVNQGGQIVYQEEGKDTAELYNTISTPRGRQFKIVLADGSRVWLNASSSIRYPVTFRGGQRRVEVTGEAYFEVEAFKEPFIVRINGGAGETKQNPSEVQVLGTKFNINAYHDELSTSVSLLEGAIKVSSGNINNVLRPGQQARLDQQGFLHVIQNADMDAIIAWKTGSFSFKHADLSTIMRQLSRWYDVDVVYNGTIPQRLFGGEISRNADLSDVLKILELSKVHFKLEGRNIMVSP